GVGLTSTSLGLVRALQRAGLKVGYFKPVEQSAGNPELVARTHGLTPPRPLSLAHVENLLGDDRLDELLEELVSLQQQAAADHDVLIIEGLVPSRQVGYANRLNTKLARALSAEAILVSSPDGGSPAALVERIEIQARMLERVPVAGVILNKIRQDQWPQPPGERLPGSELPLLACIPWQDELNAVRTCDIVEAVQARVLNEGESRLRRVQQLLLCASSAPRLATDLQAGTLLVSPVDRGDVLLAAALAGM